MTPILIVLFALILSGVLVVYENHLRHDFCRATLERSGFKGIAELADHGANGRKAMGASSVEVTLRPNDTFDVAHVEAVFARSPDHPTLTGQSAGRGLFPGAPVALGWGDEGLTVTFAEACLCLGTPAPSRLLELKSVYWLDLHELSVSDFLVTARATIYTGRSREHARRRQDLSLGAQILTSGKQEASRDAVCGQALDVVVDLLAAIDGGLRRHAAGPPEEFWRRAWRNTEAPTARAQALGIYARTVGEDAMWDEAIRLGDASDLVALWRRDDVRASARFGPLERAAILSADRLDHPDLQKAFREQVEPSWLDLLTWPQARTVILPLLRKHHGIDALAPFLARLAQRSSANHRGELLATLGSDAERLTARGGLSVAHDDGHRGALSSATDSGGLSPADD